MNDILAVNYFCERTSSSKLDWVLNTSLILFSNVIWHAYRLIAETKIFRLGGYIFYMLRKNKLAKSIIQKDILELSGIFTINDQF